jgi:exopolyphosphatase/guanosine-5'-triphosphate,3'-diphosphate pyrophosphatase
MPGDGRTGTAPMDQRTAIADLGTNTFKLLVASLTPEGKLRTELEEEVPVFLGKGGIERNMIAEAPFQLGLEVLGRFKETALAAGATDLIGFGTSALRNARNGQRFVDRAMELHGIPIAIIPGEDEAGLILEGVRQAVPFGAKPLLVMDIGGGSTEFILATDRALMWKRSFELGTTRLLERFPATDPMDLPVQLRMAAHIDACLEPLWAVMDRHWPRTLIGSEGSFGSMAAMIARQRGNPMPADAVECAFTTTEFDALKDLLLPMERRQRTLVPGLPAHRVDTMLPALVLVERVLLHGVEELHWSRWSLKEGAAMRALAKTQGY